MKDHDATSVLGSERRRSSSPLRLRRFKRGRGFHDRSVQAKTRAGERPRLLALSRVFARDYGRWLGRPSGQRACFRAVSPQTLGMATFVTAPLAVSLAHRMPPANTAGHIRSRGGPRLCRAARPGGAIPNAWSSSPHDTCGWSEYRHNSDILKPTVTAGKASRGMLSNQPLPA